MRNPWITSGIINSIAHRYRLYNKWKKTTNKICLSGDLRLHEEYRKYRNNLSKLIRISKQRFYKTKFDNAIGNLKQTWALINELRGKQKNALPAYFKSNGTIVTDSRDIANMFNTYFGTIAEDMNQSILNHQSLHKQNEFSKFLPSAVESTLFVEETTITEMSDIIKDFSNDKASDIPIVVIKHCAQVLAPVLCNIYNNCIKAGSFPNALKLGKITPVYKKGSKDDIKNHRPVSTLPIFGKIFEKILYSCIYNFMMSKNVIYEAKFGFRTNHSTCHAIQHSVDFMNKAHLTGKHVLGIFIDLSKAFDTINHSILLHKLYHYGVRGIAHSLLTSYFKNRHQYVKVNEEASNQLPVNFGVPQGSVLGPLLFIYISMIFITPLKIPNVR